MGAVLSMPACSQCGALAHGNADPPITWKCQVCNRLVCRSCTLTIPGSDPVEYYETTLCSRTCWEKAGRPDA
jgi:hypothetical protein